MSNNQSQPDPTKVEAKDIPTRKVRFLMVNPQDFLLLFSKGLVLAKRFKVLTGVPNDAQFVSMTVDHVRGGVIFVVQSETYEPVPVNEIPPVQHIEIEMGVKNATKKSKK